jgi:AAA domain-containing protein
MMVATLPRAVVDLEDYNESDNLLVFGDSGSGKSVLIGQLYWHLKRINGKCLIMSSEGGIFVAKKYLKEQGVSDADIKRYFKVWPVRKWQDLEDAYIWVRDNPGFFKWVAMDSATSLQGRAMRLAMETAVRKSPEKRDIDLPDKGEHQKMQNAMKRMITDWNELPENILWLANAMRREDEEGDDIVVPFIMGKNYDISVWAAAQVHACMYYQKTEEKEGNKVVVGRELLFDVPPPFWTKDRYGVWGDRRLMSVGKKKLCTLSDLIDELAANPEAVRRARQRVAEQDDEAGGELPVRRTAKKAIKKSAKKAVPNRGGFRPAAEEE